MDLNVLELVGIRIGTVFSLRQRQGCQQPCVRRVPWPFDSLHDSESCCFASTGASGLSQSLVDQLRAGLKAVACVAQLSNPITTEREAGGAGAE